MTKCGWTKGPWSVNRHGAVVGGPIQTYANGSGQDQIAMACMTNSIDGDAMQANALLIAAAPQLYEALAELLSKAEREECHHESTHRGGAIWTFCNDCGQKWADDEGGFVPYVEPPHIDKARAALAAARGEG